MIGWRWTVWLAVGVMFTVGCRPDPSPFEPVGITEVVPIALPQRDSDVGQLELIVIPVSLFILDEETGTFSSRRTAAEVEDGPGSLVGRGAEAKSLGREACSEERTDDP